MNCKPAIEQADKLFRKLITAPRGRACRLVGLKPHENALAVSPDGAALSGHRDQSPPDARNLSRGCAALCRRHCWRAQGTRTCQAASVPTIDLLGQPHLIEPFGARMRKASQAAIDVMRGKIPESGTLPSVPDTPPTPPRQEMVRHPIRCEPPIRQNLQPCSSERRSFRTTPSAAAAATRPNWPKEQPTQPSLTGKMWR